MAVLLNISDHNFVMAAFRLSRFFSEAMCSLINFHKKTRRGSTGSSDIVAIARAETFTAKATEKIVTKIMTEKAYDPIKKAATDRPVISEITSLTNYLGGRSVHFCNRYCIPISEVILAFYPASVSVGVSLDVLRLGLLTSTDVIPAQTQHIAIK